MCNVKKNNNRAKYLFLFYFFFIFNFNTGKNFNLKILRNPSESDADLTGTVERVTLLYNSINSIRCERVNTIE